MRFKIRGGRKPSGNIVIAGIEAKGIEAYGRWPWPRSVFAQLLVRLKESGAKTIVFDLLFPEPEKNNVAQAITSLTKTYKELDLLKDNFHSQIFFDEMSQIIKESDNDSLMAEAVDW
jgi:adenylate cyclase